MDSFDDNGDCNVTRDEIRPCQLVGGQSPFDVDLLDEDGTFNPRSDGVRDSISFALGFSAVPASFVAP